MTETEDVQDVLTQLKDKKHIPAATRSIARFIVGNSVRFVVVTAISAHIPVESRKDKVRLAIASYALSGIISEKAKQYVCDEIDDKVKFYRSVMDQVKKNEADATNP